MELEADSGEDEPEIMCGLCGCSASEMDQAVQLGGMGILCEHCLIVLYFQVVSEAIPTHATIWPDPRPLTVIVSPAAASPGASNVIPFRRKQQEGA